MLPDALPQLIATLLRLPHLDAAQLRQLLQGLPNPEVSAQEMLRRGWITADQFSSLFPNSQQQPAAKETVLVGFGDDDLPPDADGENWELPIGDDENRAEVPPLVEGARPARTEEAPEPETVGAVPALSGAASNPEFGWDMLAAPPAVDRIGPRRPATDPDKLLKQWMGWSGKGLLMWVLFAGSFYAGLQAFGAKSKASPAARQAAKVAKKTPTKKGGVARPQITPAKPAKAPEKGASPFDDPDLPLDQRAADYNARMRAEAVRRMLEEQRQRQLQQQRLAENARPAVPAPTPVAAPVLPASRWRTVSQDPPEEICQQDWQWQKEQRNRELLQAGYQQQALARQQAKQMQQMQMNPWWLNVQLQQLQVIGFPR